MIIDGRAIAREILVDVTSMVADMKKPPHLTVFTCAPNFETQKFLNLKKLRALEAGIVVEVIALDPILSTTEIIRSIQQSVAQTDGIIVQLPFPASVDITSVLEAVPRSHDVDALLYDGEQTNILPPVVGAIDSIAKRFDVVWSHKKVVVVGRGRLVGAPAALYAKGKGSFVTVLEKRTTENAAHIAEADILVLGAGVPALVNASMIKSGVYIFDAGTSEEGGMLVGDAASDVSEKAALLTPVPGGIGPITVAVLLRNLVNLVQNRHFS